MSVLVHLDMPSAMLIQSASQYKTVPARRSRAPPPPHNSATHARTCGTHERTHLRLREQLPRARDRTPCKRAIEHALCAYDPKRVRLSRVESSRVESSWLKVRKG